MRTNILTTAKGYGDGGCVSASGMRLKLVYERAPVDIAELNYVRN